MNKRQAKLEALGFAIDLLEAQVNASNEMYEDFEDPNKVHDALEEFIQQLRDKLDRMK